MYPQNKICIGLVEASPLHKDFGLMLLREEQGESQQKPIFGRRTSYNYNPDTYEKGKQLLRQLREFKELKDDWDSYGGKPITLQAIEAASSIIWKTCFELDEDKFYILNKLLGDVSPCGDGGLDIYLEYNSRKLFIEVNPPGWPVNVLKIENEDTTEEKIEGEFSVNSKQFPDYFSWLIETQ